MTTWLNKGCGRRVCVGVWGGRKTNMGFGRNGQGGVRRVWYVVGVDAWGRKKSMGCGRCGRAA